MGMGVAGAHGAFVSGLNCVGSGGVEPRRLVLGCGGRWVVVVVAAVAVVVAMAAVAGRANGFNAEVGRVVGRAPAHGALVFSMTRGAGGGWWYWWRGGSDPTDDSEALASAAAAAVAAASSSAVSDADHRKMFPK